MKDWVYGRIAMEEAAGAEGEGGGGGAAAGGAAGAEGGEGGASAGGEGGEGAAAGGEGEGGALSNTNVPAQESIDFEKITDDEYVGKLGLGEDAKVDTAALMKNFGSFIRENKVDPKVVAKYIEAEGKIIADQEAEAKKAHDAEVKAFREEGEALRRAYNPEQIASAVSALKGIGADEKFMRYATRELSNNATLVKLLVNWNETHSDDGVTHAGGTPKGQERTFEQVWCGK